MLLQTNKSYSSYFRSAFIFIFFILVSRETQRMFDCLESFTFPLYNSIRLVKTNNDKSEEKN